MSILIKQILLTEVPYFGLGREWVFKLRVSVWDCACIALMGAAWRKGQRPHKPSPVAVQPEAALESGEISNEIDYVLQRVRCNLL